MSTTPPQPGAPTRPTIGGPDLPSVLARALDAPQAPPTREDRIVWRLRGQAAELQLCRDQVHRALRGRRGRAKEPLLPLPLALQMFVSDYREARRLVSACIVHGHRSPDREALDAMLDDEGCREDYANALAFCRWMGVELHHPPMTFELP